MTTKVGLGASDDNSGRVFLGAVALDEDETLAIDIPADLDPDAVKAAIEKANAERHAAAKRESEALAKLFLNKAAIETKDAP